MAPTALLSVSNKEGLLPLAKALSEKHGYNLLSSGGTAKVLENASLPVTRVSDYTGAPEILGGRVKTLHPKIHGGILAKRGVKAHEEDVKKNQIPFIDLVVVNLYPFRETISKADVNWEKAIENIDIGGPAMVRAAAKNHQHVAVLTSPDQYEDFLNKLNSQGEGLTHQIRQKLAIEAFEHTAAYDIAISQWMNDQSATKSSIWLEAAPQKQLLRYGENPHQKAVWYSKEQIGWGGADQLQGKDLSTNNLLDLEAALSTVREFGYGLKGRSPRIKPAAVVVKHTNPCGAAISNHIETALTKALDGDRVSAFGGIVALNSAVNASTAKELVSLFLECVVAPDFEREALNILSSKKNLRLLRLPPNAIDPTSNNQVRSIQGGFLVQDEDNKIIDSSAWKVTTKLLPTNKEMEDLKFAWSLVRHVRSNAILVASAGQSLGIGAGQMNRIGSAKLALDSAGGDANGAVLASDGFFPFDDTVRLAARYGITAIIQPGGSIKDEESISACNELGISMVTTGQRHFLH